MPRTRTKGSTICVQLPLDTDAAVRHAAERAGQTPGRWLTDWITDGLNGGEAAKPTPDRKPSNTCSHGRSRRILTALWECADCGTFSRTPFATTGPGRH